MTTWHDVPHMPGASCVTYRRNGGEDLWFPSENTKARASKINQAHEICLTCPTSHVCCAYADANNEQHGMWGGVYRQRGRTRSEREFNKRRSAIQRAAMEEAWQQRGVTVPALAPIAYVISIRRRDTPPTDRRHTTARNQAAEAWA